MSTKSKYVLYARSPNQEGLTKQIESLRGLKEGDRLMPVFTDIGSAGADRSGYTSLIEYIRRGNATGVIVADLSRLYRSINEALPLINLMEGKMLAEIVIPVAVVNTPSQLYFDLAIQSIDREINKQP